MERIFTYHIDAESEGLTIGSYLKNHGYSRQNLIELKKMKESILLNNKWEYITCKLTSGDILVVHLLETTVNEKILPVKLDFSILYEDEDIMVVNKPANMPIHPSLNNYENSLANAVAYYFKEQNIPYTFRCINRLDKDTTGLTILAKHMISANILSQMLLRREIDREYLAITDTPLPTCEGTINAPIARVEDSAITRCVDFDRGETAITHYKKIMEQNGNTLISLHLETGRTHQIRVHLSSIGCPLIGDYLYHPVYADDNAVKPFDMKRQALHAYKLTFKHPLSNEPLIFEAPLPEDMKNLMDLQ